MGATVTTFCNATNIMLYTSLSVFFPYYATDQLQPGKCVSYAVGRVWFTASAEISSDNNVGNLYFPISENQAAGLLHGLPYYSLETIKFVNMTAEEADQVMVTTDDIIGSDYTSVSDAYVHNQEKLHVQIVGYYGGSDKKITITGGPKGAVYKEHPLFPGYHIEIVSANPEPLIMTVS